MFSLFFKKYFVCGAKSSGMLCFCSSHRHIDDLTSILYKVIINCYRQRFPIKETKKIFQKIKYWVDSKKFNLDDQGILKHSEELITCLKSDYIFKYPTNYFVNDCDCDIVQYFNLPSTNEEIQFAFKFFHLLLNPDYQKYICSKLFLYEIHIFWKYSLILKNSNQNDRNILILILQMKQYIGNKIILSKQNVEVETKDYDLKKIIEL